MTAYWLFFAIEFAIIFMARCFGFKNRMLILIPVVVLSVLFSGLRGNVGTDTYSYRFFYNYFFLNEQIAFEPLFGPSSFRVELDQKNTM